MERDETAAGARVIRRAEGLPGVDLDGEQAMRHSCSIMTAINEKAPGFDRSALTLRQRHPIFIGDWLDTQSRVWCAICGVLDQREQRIAGRSLGEMGEDLEAIFTELKYANRYR